MRSTPRTHTVRLGRDSLPLEIKPEVNGHIKAGKEELLSWLEENDELVEDKLLFHGALLFRGFDISGPLDFQDVAWQIDDGLQAQYLGTAPRNARTKYVFNSTELPPIFPIPQHCEMSFMKDAPRRLFFFCNHPPESGGETPIVDARKVFDQMDKSIREEFETKGIRHVRNYDGPHQMLKVDLSKLKTWDQVFNTTNKKDIEETCRKRGQYFEWLDKDSLKLVNDGDAFKVHPVTGKKAWFNHAQVFHAGGPVFEAGKVASRQKSLKMHLFSLFLRSAARITRTIVPPEKRGTHVTFRDGSAIPEQYIRHVQEVIWDNMVFHQWEQGDILAIDNYTVSHGRMPFQGKREIMVAWTD